MLGQKILELALEVLVLVQRSLEVVQKVVWLGRTAADFDFELVEVQESEPSTDQKSLDSEGQVQLCWVFPGEAKQADFPLYFSEHWLFQLLQAASFSVLNISDQLLLRFDQLLADSKSYEHGQSFWRSVGLHQVSYERLRPG